MGGVNLNTNTKSVLRFVSCRFRDRCVLLLFWRSLSVTSMEIFEVKKLKISLSSTGVTDKIYEYQTKAGRDRFCFSQVVGNPSCYQSTSSSTLYLTTFTFHFKVKDSNPRYFGSSKVIIWQTMTDMVEVIAIIWEIIYWLSNDILTFDLGSL